MIVESSSISCCDSRRPSNRVNARGAARLSLNGRSLSINGPLILLFRRRACPFVRWRVIRVVLAS
jgi:hypothetical protein